MHRGSKTMQLDKVSRARRLAFLPSVEAVFEDFKGRRAGLLKALTCDIDELLRQCDPLDDKEALCLFGFPDGSWEVTSPDEDVPSERPEPLVGINHTMDRISGREQWLLFVASHSDSWLLSTALFAASPFDHVEKQRLFDLMTALPTLYHIVSCSKMVQENEQDRVGSSGASHEISQIVQQNKQDLHVYSSGASHEISHVTTGTIEKLGTDRRPARGALARSSSSLKNANPLQKSKHARGSGEDHLESMKKRIKVVDPRKSEETAAAAATKSWEAGSSFSSLETSFRSAALDAASPLEFDLNQMPEDLG